MDHNTALEVLERHRNVLAGALPTPSTEDHHKALEEALTWALDELTERNEEPTDEGSTVEAPNDDKEGGA